MKKRILYLLLTVLLLVANRTESRAQTTLAAGDIAFVMLNLDASPMTWAWVPLVDISSGTVIYFTDDGWSGSAGAFIYTESALSTNNEDLLTFTATSSIAAGTVITFNGTTFSPSYGTLSWLGVASPSSTSGDQMIAFQGSFASPTFITGVHSDYNATYYDSSTHWHGSTVPSGLASSSIPSGLTDGTNCVSLFPGVTEKDNAKYTGATTIGTKVELLAAINNYANWSSDDTTPYTWSGNFTVNPSAVAPTITTQAVSSIVVTTATGNGNITSLGSPNPTQYGVVWGTSINPTVALSTKTTQGAASATGAFTSSITGLSANTLYHVRAYATNTAGTSYGDDVTFTTLTNGTFTGATNNDWGTGTNWAGGSIPGSGTDVTIPSGKNPVIGATTSADCNDLTVTGSLTIQSSASGTGSLKVNGTSTGNVSCERYMTGSAWHVVSPIAAGGSISTFIQAAGNAIPSNSGNYGMMDYNETTNLWNDYFTTATAGNLTAGKGYNIRRSANGVVTFTGTLTSGTKTVNITKAGSEGWNCVGNPYTSAINMNTAAGASNFLATNSSNLDASYACIYVWDDASSSYKIMGNVDYGARDLGQNVLQSGQGFFVKALNNSSLSVQFTSAMQVHSTGTALKSGQVSWPGFELTASSAQAKASTVVAFNNEMTKGLDPTYDAGLLRGTSDISIHTRLVDDNGVDFAIQCLPENYPEYSGLVIPVGVDFKTGGEITFSAETVELPASCSVILEDKTEKTFTSLTDGATYKTTVQAGTTAIGRFYIHTSSLTTGTSGLTPPEAFSLKAFPANGYIQIAGKVGSSAKAYLFNANGSNLGSFNLQGGFSNSIPTDALASGVYLLNVVDGSNRYTAKIVLFQK